MNLFRSEEHVRQWALFEPSSQDGIVPVADFTTIVAGPRHRERLAPDYLLRVAELSRDMPARFERAGKGSPFWRM
jgi:hypothetical protein